MANFLSLFVALVLATVSAGFAVAQTPTPAPTEKPAEEKKPQKPAEARKMPMKNANGTVKSASADSIVVAGMGRNKDAEWTFAVDPKTSIRRGGKSITAADLKPGDVVHVRYMDADGKAMAQFIMVKGSGIANKGAKTGKK